MIVVAALACSAFRLHAGGACSSDPLDAACRPSADEAAGAGLGLLQFDSSRVAPQRAAAGAGAGAGAGEFGHLGAATNLSDPRSNPRGLLSAVAGVATEVSCALYPTLCEAPFNCHLNPPTPEELAYWSFGRVATEEGHSNLRTWCIAPEFYGSVATLCLKNHDLKANAQRLYRDQVMRGIGQADGSYCFLEGHCSNMDVTYDTTPEQAEAVCDAKYGHENWTSVTFTSILNDPVALGASLISGFRSRELSSVFGKLACAMGNFHCDVIYCQDTFCRRKEYVERYGHFLKDYGYSSL